MSFMDQELYSAARNGHLVLTVNDRLSRHLIKQFDFESLSAGPGAWFRPEILSLSSWLSECQLLLADVPTVLNYHQLQYVWEKIIAEDVLEYKHLLLQVPHTARKALQAYQLLVSYDTDFNSDFAAEDHLAFLRWRSKWIELSQQQGWSDPFCLPKMVAAAIENGCIRVPKKVIWAGFDELPPDLQHLFEAMQNKGASVHLWQSRPFTARYQKVVAKDGFEEISCCARWIRNLISNRPTEHIGVVVPNLGIYRSLIERVFLAELLPGSLVKGDFEQPLFNISLGTSLSNEAVVEAALCCLRIGSQVTYKEISWLLNTPYLGRALTETMARALIDRELRRLRCAEWTLSHLAKVIVGLEKKLKIDIPSCVNLVQKLSGNHILRGKKLPGAWAEYFTNFLAELGWPGERRLSSREFQAIDHFKKAMSQLAGLDGVSKPFGGKEAVGILARLVSTMEFQPEGGDAPVQVLGVLESSGMTFDHLWVMGLNDNALPGSPAPSPFIPVPIQRKLQMKRAGFEREYYFAEQISQRLFSSAPDIVVSWPKFFNEIEQRPSPFIAEIPEGFPSYADACSPDQIIWQNRPALENVFDIQGPAISTKKTFTGGISIIKDQALCPFRAFAHHRLRAEGLEVPEIGIDNISRGKLVHAALEIFWKDVVDLSSLAAFDEHILMNKINSCVVAAMKRLERERRYFLPFKQREIEMARQVVLIRNWLKMELQRTYFRVVEVEKSHQVKVGSLTIRTRIDRIDQLDDGTYAIIDYKTGRPDPSQWLTDRITEPQLPLYCAMMQPDEVGAVLFAEIRSKSKECGFRGLARSSVLWPKLKSRNIDQLLEENNWHAFQDVVAHWRSVLPVLGDEFASGYAAVDPVGFDLSCKYCDLVGFCRILGKGILATEFNND